jgi:type I restriction enzyme R subunit
VSHTEIGTEGMRIDREGFRRAVEEDILANDTLSNLWKNGDIIEAEEYTKKHIFDKPAHFLNLQKIRKIFNIDRRISIREFLEVAFGEKDTFANKDELLESEWEKFVETHEVDQAHYTDAKHFFKAYITDPEIRDIIEGKKYAELYQSPTLSFEEFARLNGFKTIIPQYVKDYVSLNTFMN